MYGNVLTLAAMLACRLFNARVRAALHSRDVDFADIGITKTDWAAFNSGELPAPRETEAVETLLNGIKPEVPFEDFQKYAGILTLAVSVPARPILLGRGHTRL